VVTERDSEEKTERGKACYRIVALSLNQATGTCTALVVAIPKNEVRHHQEHLLEVGVRPRRIEFTPLITLGAIKSHFPGEIIGPHFEDIKLSGLERFDEEDGLSFEFTMIPVGGEDA
tara:strand:+ start:20033 stop:20383 length:351 start_codon:yes stop_codon:yes gene_type:complete